jgi:hypothetical protein
MNFLAAALVVTSAHVGPLTPTPAAQPAGRFQILGGTPAWAGTPTLPARTAIPPTLLYIAGGVSYQVPASQMGVLGTQRMPTGTLSLTLVTGSGTAAQMVQFAISAHDALLLCQTCQYAVLAQSGAMPPSTAKNTVNG